MNTESIAQVIYWRRSFTENELIQTFSRLRDRQVHPGPVDMLRRYLERLRELGVLGFKGGRYFLLNPAKGRHLLET